MKKEKFFNFLSSKWLVVAFVAFGITMFSSMDAVAQSSSQIDDVIATITERRNSQVPGTAKFDFAQAALDYLSVLDTNLASNPNYLDLLQDQSGNDPLQAAPMRRVHPSILANYTAAQLASFQSQVDGGTSVTSQKLQWILDANAY